MSQPTHKGRPRKEEFEDYEGFVEKFRPKLTTDDCLTPAPVYEAILSYLHEIEAIPTDAPIVRPFWPGADYKKEAYPAGSVVVDNPPFSIISEIVQYYVERRQPFFLFAPHLTLTRFARIPGVTCVVTCASVTYANGARVSTSFLSYGLPPFEPYLLLTLPDLLDVINQANTRPPSAQRSAYVYPSHVTSVAILGRYASVPFHLTPSEARYIPGLDSQRHQKKSIYGGGLLLSTAAAARLAAARLAAAKEVTEWTLSPREEEMIKELDKNEVSNK